MSKPFLQTFNILEFGLIPICLWTSTSLTNVKLQFTKSGASPTFIASQMLATSLVLSHLDYSNSLLCILPKNSQIKLQRVQNWAAKILLQRDKLSDSCDALKPLHWGYQLKREQTLKSYFSYTNVSTTKLQAIQPLCSKLKTINEPPDLAPTQGSPWMNQSSENLLLL